MVDARDHAADAELGLGEQGYDQVDLVVTRRGDDHVVVLQLGLFEHRHLAGVTVDPRRALDRLGLQRSRLALDEEHVVTVFDELQRDRATDVAGAGDSDALAGSGLLQRRLAGRTGIEVGGIV